MFITSKSKKTLKIHIESVHEHVRYPCDQCEFQATTTWDLKRHTATVHEGVRYHCDQCEFKSTAMHYLRKHLKTVHNICFDKGSDPGEKLAVTWKTLYENR